LRRALFAFVVLLTPTLLFCGSFGSDGNPTPANDAAQESVATTDANVEGAATPDSGDGSTPAAKCAYDTPFKSPPTHLSTISTTFTDLGIWLSPDELEVWIGSGFDFQDAGVRGALYRATRGQIGAQFSTAIAVADGEFADPVLTEDLQHVYFVRSSTPPPNYQADIYVASRENAQGPFGVATLLGQINESTSIEAVPSLSPGGEEIFFSSNRVRADGGTGSRIYRATKTGSAFGPPVEVSELDPSGAKAVSLPVLSHDRTTLYFTIANDDVNVGSKVVHRARRNDVGAKFENLQPVPEINGFNQYPRWLSKDECRLYVGENRPGGKGLLDLYVYERQP